MSTSLYWSRIPVEPKETSLYSLKWILGKKLWDADGSSSQPTIKVGRELIPFLEGIEIGSDGGDTGKDARKLINAIESYGEVQLQIHS